MKKTNQFLKRLLAAFLAVLMLSGIFTVTMPEEAEAASNTLVTDAVINARINELDKKLSGTYWNTTHERGKCKGKCSGHDCKYCKNYKIIRKKWFIKLFKFSEKEAEKLSTNLFPKTFGTTSDKNIFPSAASCAGFASFAEWYIFRTQNTAKVETKKIGSYESNQENWTKYAKVGDLIRWGTHSFIYISNNKKGIKVLDCNWSGTDREGKTAKPCMVQIHTLKYTAYSSKFTISREITRATCKHKNYKTEWNGTKYVATVCKKCGATFNYKVKSYTDTVTVKTAIGIYKEPYEDASKTATCAAQTRIDIIGKVKNAYGNTWYKVTYETSGKTVKGFVYSGSINSAQEEPDAPTQPDTPGETDVYYTYNIKYVAEDGTSLGGTTIKNKKDTSQKVTAPAIDGYETPAAKTVTWDTAEKTITFTYKPVKVYPKTTVTGTWWEYNGKAVLTYKVVIETRNRTADSIEYRVKWTNSIVKDRYYGYTQKFAVKCGDFTTGKVTICGASKMAASTKGTVRTATATSSWVKVTGLSSTATSLKLKCYGYSDDNISFSKTITIPAY